MMEAMTGMDSDERLWEARLVADVRAGVRLAENELYAYCCSRSAGILRGPTSARFFFVRRRIAWRWSSLRRYAIGRSQLRPARRHVVG